MKPWFLGLALSIPLFSNIASASTGVCDKSPPASTQACINAIQNNGGVVNDVFKDSNGLTGDALPVYGKLFNQWPNCPDLTDFGSCSGQSNPPYDCPSQYTCTGLPNSFANASQFLNALDRKWWQPCRLANPNLVNGCPNFVNNCIADGTGGNYYPWEGSVFDLGGPSNQVVVFAENDHGPQPCESLEYTVYLTDNPYALDLITDPKTSGVDPMKWNRAVLSKIFTKGFVEVRPPDPAGHLACGDTATYSVEEDSFAQVFSLPCGITFRYAAVIAGNDGLDFPECAYDSSEAELDAVAGLTEGGAGVCPDADGDHFVDCNCMGAPMPCDCNDADPTIHPGAPEKCDDPDKNCDNKPGACDPGLTCYQSLCDAACSGGENPFCPAGTNCTQTPQGNLCVPQDCSVAGCPAGSVCVNKVCLPACTGVVCPGNQICQDGACIDPCVALQCPAGQGCTNGKCHPPCNCFAGDLGCADLPGTVCDTGNSDNCVAPPCKGKTCMAPQTCDPQTGNCIDFCNMDVKCPVGQKCDNAAGCIPVCTGVTCDAGFQCNQVTGVCEDHRCDGVSCVPPNQCVAGMCVEPDGGAAGGGGAGGHGGHGGTSVASSSSAGGAPQQNIVEVGGCGCRIGGQDAGPFAALGLSALAFAAAIARRRRGIAGPR
jgi:MYXO-CTERM domain-containing protein